VIGVDGDMETWRTDIGGSAVLVALFVEPVGVRDEGVGVRIVKFVRFDMLEFDRCGKRSKNLECLVGDVKVRLESTFETAKGWMREAADHGFVVDVSADCGGGDGVVA
jgi:hypothetical protein